MITKQCLFCKKDFLVEEKRIDKAKFCCVKCYWSSLSGTQRPNARKRVEKECSVCNKKFIVRECHKHVKTCSVKCGGISRRGKRQNTKPLVSKLCLNCNNEFQRTNSLSKLRTFCSRTCYLDFKTKNSKYPQNKRLQSIEWIKIRRKVIKRDKVCVLCGGKGKSVHHKVPFSISGDNGLNNLILLCNSCHLHIHNIIWTAEKSGYRVDYDNSGKNMFLVLNKI